MFMHNRTSIQNNVVWVCELKPMIVSLPIGDKGVGLFVHDVMGNFPILKVLSAFSQKAVKCVFNSNCCYNEEVVLVDCNMNNLQPQSGEDTNRPTSDASTVEQVNLTFNDDVDEGTVLTPTVKSLYKPTSSQNSDISRFLNRPVLVRTVNIALGTTTNDAVSIWHAFFSHPSIKKKIDNYAFVRCDLHIKVVINASPFYYGAVLVSYCPMKIAYNPAIIGSGTPLVPYSQRPNIVAYPQTCQGGEMILPFLYNKEWLDLTSSLDLAGMGTIEIDSYTPLRSANGTVGTSVDLQIYAWAENVELAGLTVKLAVQSGDEYGKGIVSKPASAIARSTGLLSSMPIIGPFMTATSVAASAVSNIASLFGYSKVPVLDDVKPFKNLPFHGLAVSDISDCTEKLSVDSKNELTINNTCIGDNCADPLIISNFVQRSSYLTQFTWSASDAASSLLWNTYVSPYMYTYTSGTGQGFINGTPSWLVSNMFSYWRGDIIFDLKVIASQYHKGRLRVSWDPVGDIAATTNSSTEVYTTIIDISDTDTVSLRVPYCQKLAYSDIPSEPVQIFGTAPLAVSTNGTYNGILTVRVLNEQTSPIASADIVVLVHVRGAENLEFALPREIPEQLAYYSVQSGLENLQDVNFGGNSTVDDHINLVYMGEKVENLRSLLMRSSYYRTDILATSTTLINYCGSYPNRRPIFRGYDPNGIHSAVDIVGVGNSPYNFVSNTPYHLLSQCFLGERGSFTWKVNLNSVTARSLSVSRSENALTAVFYDFAQTAMNGSSNQSKTLLIENDKTVPGTSLINQKTNTGMSVNAPLYSNYTFLDTSTASRTLGLTGVSTNDSLHVSFRSFKTSTVEAEHVDYYFQVGPDYSPVYFLNVPTMYYYDSIPNGQP